jgi:hypothetical protein
MQQRRLRPGDILDDYCPRERRVTNHVVVAMVEDGVKQTRCGTCDAEHEYKEAKAPVLRRAKVSATPSLENGTRPVLAVSPPPPRLDDLPHQHVMLAAASAPPSEASEPELDSAPPPAEFRDDDAVVHRRLIRATLPRPEGHVPERRPAEFTVRQPGARGRDDGNRGGRPRGPQMHGQGFANDASRYGGPRQGGGGQGFDGRSGNVDGQRGNRPPGPGRGPRPGGGAGRKRGR